MENTKTIKTTDEVKTAEATTVEEVKTEKTEVKVTNKQARNILASKVMAEIKPDVEKCDDFCLDTDSPFVRDYSYFIGILYRGKKLRLMNIWPHPNFIDVNLGHTNAKRLKDTHPELLEGVTVLDNGKEVIHSISNEDPETLKSTAVDFILKVMEALKPVPVEEKPKAEKPKKEKKPKAEKPAAEKKDGAPKKGKKPKEVKSPEVENGGNK